MSRMNDLLIDIQDEIERGGLSFSEIATLFEVPVGWVEEVAAQMIEFLEYDDSMDGDHA